MSTNTITIGFFSITRPALFPTKTTRLSEEEAYYTDMVPDWNSHFTVATNVKWYD